MAVAEQCHVAVYLVADDDDVVVVAEAGKPCQCPAVPAYPGGVVRVAQEKHAASRVAHLLEIPEVHAVAAVGVEDEGVAHHLPAVALGREAEGVIHGRLDDDFVAGRGEDIHCHADALHDAGDVAEPFALRPPPVVRGHPVCHALPVFVRNHGVAQDGMVQPPAQRLDDKVRRGEVHVCHPQREEGGVAETFRQHTVLVVVAAAAVDDAVKIVWHTFSVDEFFFCR